MARLLLVLMMSVVLCNMYVSALNTDSRNKRTSDKIGDLREKLSKLKQMLDDIDQEPDKTTQAPVKVPTDEENVSQEKQKSDQGENTLTKQDILLLKSLQSALGNMKTEEKPSKQEILDKIVYRLLADLDLALKNGISVEDIIHYLYKAEKAARDRQQRNRIEDEESQLKALLNQHPGPRD